MNRKQIAYVRAKFLYTCIYTQLHVWRGDKATYYTDGKHRIEEIGEQNW